ncbi:MULTISPECIES: hypothetical protein [Shewanella]|uniref:hypothetical protein n=1 Tax=Shewanella TaxID=22 RepID=UPI00163D7988|nr:MULTISPECIES: hypothetical protein [Shewanella]
MKRIAEPTSNCIEIAGHRGLSCKHRDASLTASDSPRDIISGFSAVIALHIQLPNILST